MSFEIKTIQDMQELYYGKGQDYVVRKDAPVLTTTTGVYNAVYGAMVWAQLNREANAFGLLPKYPWLRSGWRVITARAAASGGGVAENGDIPATIKPTFAELSAKPKTIAHAFDVSEVQGYLASQSLDDAIGSMEQLRPEMATHHREMINVMLLRDVSAEASDAGAARDSTEDSNWNQFESLDRIVASDGEEDQFGGSYANWFDPWGTTVDRDSGTTYDSYVSHNSGTDRALTDELIRTMFYQTKSAGGNTNVVLTGLDTYSKVQGIYDAYVRYNPVGESTVRFSVNGIETSQGTSVGIHIPSLYGVPLVTSKDAPQDTLSRIFFLDTSDPEGYGQPRLGIQIAKPTQYFEAGIDTGTPHALGRLGTEGMFRTMGELICKHFPGQGKLRDLK